MFNVKIVKIMKCKSINVNLDLRIELFEKLQLIENLIRDVEGSNYSMIITSAKDSVHRVNSKHYSGEAIDIRIRDMKCPNIVFDVLKNCLHDCDVILEYDHIHIEYDENK